MGIIRLWPRAELTVLQPVEKPAKGDALVIAKIAATWSNTYARVELVDDDGYVWAWERKAGQ